MYLPVKKGGQVLRFFRLKLCKTVFFSGSCSETEVSEQLCYRKKHPYYISLTGTA
jgi:hypothetical protein